MRTRIVFTASLILAFVVLSLWADRGRATQRVVTGTVGEFNAGEWMSLASDQTDPMGIRIALRDTVYEGDPAAITPGVRVTVCYRSVGERHSVADKVRVLPARNHTEPAPASSPPCLSGDQRAAIEGAPASWRRYRAWIRCSSFSVCYVSSSRTPRTEPLSDRRFTPALGGMCRSTPSTPPSIGSRARAF